MAAKSRGLDVVDRDSMGINLREDLRGDTGATASRRGLILNYGHSEAVFWREDPWAALGGPVKR